MGDRILRPFWMHQGAEYLLGGVLIAQGLQSPQPAVPAVVGGLIVLNAAIVRGGAMSAFRLVSRSVHRVLDVFVIAFTVVAALQPWVSVDNASRAIMLGIAAFQAFVWWKSSFAEKQRKPATASGADAGDGMGANVGRKAGRFVGNSVNAVRRAQAKRNSDAE